MPAGSSHQLLPDMLRSIMYRNTNGMLLSKVWYLCKEGRGERGEGRKRVQAGASACKRVQAGASGCKRVQAGVIVV